MSELEPIPIRPIPEDIVETLEQERAAVNSTDMYVRMLGQRYRRQPFRRMLNVVKPIVEPFDSALGMDPSAPHGEAFCKGGLLGFRVVQACLPERYWGSIQADFSRSGTDFNDLAAKHNLAEEIMDLGDEGYASVDTTFEPLLERWERDIAPLVAHQRYLRSGFGLPIVLMEVIHTHNEVIAEHKSKRDAAREFEQALSSPDEIDWSHLLD